MVYRTYTFKEPEVMAEADYDYYKYQLTANPNNHIYTITETFIGKYKRNLRFLIWTLPILTIAILAYFFYNNLPSLPPIINTILLVIAIGLGFIDFFVLFYLVIEGSSYATYLHNKKLYLLGMEHAVQNSTNYAGFHLLFCGGLKKGKTNYKKLGKTAMALQKEPATLDGTLITLFVFFNKLIIVAGLALILFYLWDHFIR